MEIFLGLTLYKPIRTYPQFELRLKWTSVSQWLISLSVWYQPLGRVTGKGLSQNMRPFEVNFMTSVFKLSVFF